MRRSIGDPPIPKAPSRAVIISALGVTQIFAWGTSYYLPAVLAAPIAADTGWSLTWVVGGLSLGLLTAGVISPWVGRAIARRGGRPVLALSAGLLAAGLLVLARAHSLPVFLMAWLVIGLGMGAGLYDPAFATLGRLYGDGGRSAITTLTLFGGFASTVCWPLSAFLDAHLGWRGACLVYAAFQVAVALPIYLFVLPREPEQRIDAPAPLVASTTATPVLAIPRRGLFLLLATTITLASIISTVLSVHLLTILQAKGLALAAAVSLGALVGPSQVAARTIEMFIARYHHPIWTKLAATSLVAAGLATLWVGGPVITLALVLYGAGIGLESIARGTLPLAIFGPTLYPVIMGRIAMPSLIAQAAAPSIGAILLEKGGLDGALATFLAAAAFNALLVICLFLMLRSSRRPEQMSESEPNHAHLSSTPWRTMPISSVAISVEPESRKGSRGNDLHRSGATIRTKHRSGPLEPNALNDDPWDVVAQHLDNRVNLIVMTPCGEGEKLSLQLR